MRGMELAVAFDKEARRNRAEAERQACQMYEEHTGIKLPVLEAFTDDEGNLWALQVHASLRLVRKAGTDVT